MIQKGQIKLELRDELRTELVTRELFEGQMKVIEGRFVSLENEQRQQRREMGEFRQEVNGRFDRMNERFDEVYDRMLSQTRWMVGTIALFGTLITILLAISQFTP